MRLFTVFVCLCAILCTALGALATPPSLRMEALPELPGMESAAKAGRADSVRGIDIGGWSKGANGIERAVMWHLADRDCTTVPPPAALPTLDVSRPSWVNGLIRPADTDCTAIYLCGRSVNPGGTAKPTLWHCQGGALPCTLIVLPTLPGGVGEANGVSGSDITNPICGSSRNAANVPKAVVWEQDQSEVWQVELLPHPTMASEGAALDGVALDESTTAVAGFAENAAGQMRPQVWKRIGEGPWVRTELPLLAGGTEGAGLACMDILGFNLTGWPNNASGNRGAARRDRATPGQRSATSLGTPAGRVPSNVSGPDITGWSNNASGNRVAVRWEEVSPGQWSVTSLGTLAGRMQSEGLGLCADGVPLTYLTAGTSYNTSMEVDGLGTLWETNDQTTIAYDMNSLVVGDRPLEAFMVAFGSITLGVSNENYILVGAGRSLSASKTESSSGVAQHALLLIEDNVTGVTPSISGLPIPLSTSPNPFERSASISFSMVRPGHAVLSVYDVQGRRVATLAEGYFAAGGHEAHWPAQDATGDLIGPGVYLLRLETGGKVQTQKVVQIR